MSRAFLITPLIDRLAAEYSARVKVFKLDLDANQPVAKRFAIRSIPTVMFFEQGKLAQTIVGVKTYEEFSSTLDKYLA